MSLMLKPLLAHKRLARDYHDTFSTDHGKRVLHNLMMRSRMGKTTFSENSHELAFNEGQRAAVLVILEMMHINNDPEALNKEIENARPNAYDSDDWASCWRSTTLWW